VGLDDWLTGILATAPQGNPAMRKLHALHREWLPSAQLHTAYYGVTAKNEWIWPDTADQPHLYCDQEWTFVRQVKAGRNVTHLVTRDGTASYDVLYRAAMAAGGTLDVKTDTVLLTTRQPPVPPKPQPFAVIRGDLRDF
jgi:hypothetical protein